MTPPEIAAVVGLLAVAFGKKTEPETFEVYEAALADLDVQDPRGLVLRLLRTMERWPSPAVLRKALLALHGVLPPDEDEAWRLALDLSRDPFQAVPWVVKEAVRNVGGSWSIRHADQTTIRAQFRDAYRQVQARATQAALEADWTNGLPLAGGSELPLGSPGGPGELGPSTR